MDPKEISTLSLLSVEVVHDTPGVALRGVGKIRESPHPTLRPEFAPLGFEDKNIHTSLDAEKLIHHNGGIIQAPPRWIRWQAKRQVECVV